jgi:hypothetical protein
VEVETYRAVDRERLLGRLDDEETARRRADLTLLLGAIDLVAADDEVIRLARAPFPVNVRAIDAIHVATAEWLAREAPDDPLQFWTHDERQAVAALSRGLDVRGARPGRRGGPGGSARDQRKPTGV